MLYSSINLPSQHPQLSYHDPSQSSFKRHQPVQPSPPPTTPTLRIPPEATVVGPLLVKPTEFLSEAASALGRSPQLASRHHSIP